ncbi:VCBS repeat-containing protein [candidate division WOR-3 bacterium]|nr:VCBS repeat-containing protein [candidate division WOR-3 bacterium]
MIFLPLILFAGEWVETTQQDFRDGWFTRDLYSSHRGDGAVEFVGRFDLNNDGYIDIIGCRWIMWGGANGYSHDIVTNYEGYGGSDAADVDTDGYPEYISTQVNSNPIRIYKGGPEGPSPDNPATIPTSNHNNEGVMAADFNKDGYLDLLGSKDDNNAAIYWGSTTGYSSSNYFAFPCYVTGYNPEAVDLNKDGWLDAIVTSGNSRTEFIYWGSPQGFSTNNYTRINDDHNASHGVSVADLNYDGWLDIVFSSNTIGDRYGSIMWGSLESYQEGATVDVPLQLPLPDRAFGGNSIADLDEDGYLDVVFFGDDNVPPRVYWGGQDGIALGRYRDMPYALTQGSGGMVGDFNFDGHLDLFSMDWTDYSAFFYGPDFNSYELVPIITHHGFSREIGNVYTREYREEYYSSVFEADREVYWDTIWWEDSCPGSSNITLAIRVGDTPDTSSWSGWVPVTNGELIPYNLKSRYIQYRATFTYENPAHLAVLFLVGIVYRDDVIIVEPDQQRTSFPEDTVRYELDVINLTSRTDIIDISYITNTTGWFHEAQDSLDGNLPDTDSDGTRDVGPLPSNSQTKMHMLVGIPDDIFTGVDTCVVYGRSSYPEGLYDSAILVTTVLPPVNIYVDPDQDTMALAGEIITFSLRGGNLGRDPDVIDLAVVSARGWNVELLDESAAFPVTDHDSDGMPDLDTMYRGDSKDFTARVAVPSGATEGTVDTITVLGTSSQDELITDEAILIIEVIPEVKILVEPDQDTTGYPEQEIVFELWGSNYGLITDVIDLTATSVHGWDAELLDENGAMPLSDGDADGLPDVGPLDRFQREYFTVRVKVPTGASISTTDTVHVVGRSSIRTDATDEAILVLNPLEVTNLEIRPDHEGAVSPESPTFRYQLMVINHGNGPETGDISWEGWRGWTVTVYDSTGEEPLKDNNSNGIPDVGELAAFGGSYTLFVDVTMPEDFDPTCGFIDTSSASSRVAESTWVYISSSSDGVRQDEAVLETSALPGLSVHNYPNPFVTRTTIVWSQPEPGLINLRLADRAGRPVGTIFTRNCETGVHAFQWPALTQSGKPLAPGVYLLLLEFKPEGGSSKRILYKMLCTRGGER